MARVVAIVQARMGSTRLPGKCLVDIAGKPMLQRVVERLGRARRIDEVMVATTVNPEDTPICDLTVKLGLRAFKGSAEDVLGRYLEAGRESGAEVIVRVTADCPLIDPQLSDDVVAAYFRDGADFASNVLERTFPRGVETEVFSLAGLRRIDGLTGQPFEREHVTPFFYLHPELFRLTSVTAREALLRQPELRLCVDTPEDLQLIREIYGRLATETHSFPLLDAVRVLEQEPRLAALNAHIEQKKLGE